MKHHAEFWPQGKGSCFLHHETRREGLSREGLQGPQGSSGPGTSPVAPAPAFTSVFSFSILPLPFSLAVYSPSLV